MVGSQQPMASQNFGIARQTQVGVNGEVLLPCWRNRIWKAKRLALRYESPALDLHDGVVEALDGLNDCLIT